MSKKRLLCILLSLTAVFSMFFIKDSAAWMNTETGSPLSQTIIAKKLNFEFNGALGSALFYDGSEEEYIITDQNLIIDNEGKISGINNSTVATEIRWRVVYDTPAKSDVVYTCAEDEDLYVDYDDSWVYDSGYFYREFEAVEGNSTAFDIINSISYDSDNVTKEEYRPADTPFSGAVKVEFQAKQKNFVEWTDIWTITA